MQSQLSLTEKLKNYFQEIIPADKLSGIAVRGNHVLISLNLLPEEIEQIKSPLHKIINREDSNLTLEIYSAPEKKTAPDKVATPEFKHIVAVSSGKGGVGKSTIAVNLAFALQQLGYKIGLIDADIYGPSIPHMLGLEHAPSSPDGKKMSPIMVNDVECMSMGLLMPKDQPAIWRGPMITKALTQMLTQVYWRQSDILIIDMPPGTGDVALSLAQKFTLSGAVVISTPQDLALIDARKGLKMFQALNVPILGIIENMSGFSCPHCGEHSAIFDHAGAKIESQSSQVPFLGDIPLNMKLRASGDEKTPFVLASPDDELTKSFQEIARKIMDQLNAPLDHTESALLPQV